AAVHAVLSRAGRGRAASRRARARAAHHARDRAAPRRQHLGGVAVGAGLDVHRRAAARRAGVARAVVARSATGVAAETLPDAHVARRIEGVEDAGEATQRGAADRRGEHRDRAVARAEEVGEAEEVAGAGADEADDADGGADAEGAAPGIDAEAIEQVVLVAERARGEHEAGGRGARADVGERRAGIGGRGRVRQITGARRIVGGGDVEDARQREAGADDAEHGADERDDARALPAIDNVGR